MGADCILEGVTKVFGCNIIALIRPINIDHYSIITWLFQMFASDDPSSTAHFARVKGSFDGERVSRSLYLREPINMQVQHRKLGVQK